MTATVSRLQPAAALPARLDEMLMLENWPALEEELRAGLPANLSAHEGLSLFEMMVSSQEMSPSGLRPLPASLLEALLEGGLNKGELVPGSGLTAVSLAAEYGQWEWVKTLIAAGYEVETPEWPALVAVGGGRAERYAYLLDEVSTAQEQELEAQMQPPTPEGAPAPEGNVHFFKRPESAATQIEVKSEGDLHSELFDTVSARFAEESPALRACVQLLVASGARASVCAAQYHPDPRLVQEGMSPGFPPLMEAIFRSDSDYAIALIENGADLNGTYVSARGLVGRPVDLAIHRMDSVVLAALINAGAPLEVNTAMPYDPDTVSHPLVAASRVAHGEMIDQVAAALSPEAILEFGGQAMQLAAQMGRVDVMKKLREVGVPFDVRTKTNGFLPIHQAAVSGQKEAIEFLQRRGQKLTDTSNNGVTAASLLLDQPELAKHFGITPEVSNVRAMRPRR